MPATAERRRGAAAEVATALAYLVGALVFTWPLARHFTTHLAGAQSDPYQQLWGFWWFRRALLEGRNPWFTPLLHHPFGIDLVYQPFHGPGGLLALPLFALVPEVAVYNTVLVFSFVASGLFASWLARELGCGRLAAFLGGCLYTFGPYHVGHAAAHLHVTLMEWNALYALFLVRTFRRASLGSGLAAGLALAAAATASWYHFLYCGCLTVFLLGWMLVDPAERGHLRAPRAWAGAALLVGVAMAILGPLLYGMHAAAAREEWAGAHAAVVFSADLQQLLLPNDVQALSRLVPHARWTGNAFENVDYVGWTALALAVLGAARRRPARGLLLLAGFGAVMALGPRLRWGGRVVWDGDLPYAALLRLLPALEFSGVPVRFAYLTVLGVSMAAACGLDVLAAGAARRGPRAAAAAAILPAALALAEYAPRPFPLNAYPDSPLMRTWARDPEPWAVFDRTGWIRPLWHGVLHGHPQLGGYVAREPVRLERWLEETPFVRSVWRPHPVMLAAWRGVEPGIAHDAGGWAPPGVYDAQRFAASWEGVLAVPRSGAYDLVLACDDAGRLALDGRTLLEQQGPQRLGTSTTTVELAAGEHRLRVDYEQLGGDAGVALRWRPPGGALEPIPATALRTADGEPGLAVEYRHRVNASGLVRADIRALLARLRIRYVILPASWRDYAVEVEAGLPLVHEGEGLKIYEVPEVAAGAGAGDSRRAGQPENARLW